MPGHGVARAPPVEPEAPGEPGATGDGEPTPALPVGPLGPHAAIERADQHEAGKHRRCGTEGRVGSGAVTANAAGRPGGDHAGSATAVSTTDWVATTDSTAVSLTSSA